MKYKRLLDEIDIGEIVAPENVDLSSFKIQETLNPKLWDADKKLKTEVRKRLLRIANDFYETLDINWVDIEDIIITGSLANYNWTEKSDVDLHIIINYDDVSDNPELTREFLSLKKFTWSQLHNITIYGYDVELYAQDNTETHFSSGVYSILFNKWVIESEKDSKIIDAAAVKEKAAGVLSYVDELEEKYKKKEYKGLVKAIDKIKNKIKKMRAAGLEREGEYSNENLVFKILRRTGYLEKLNTIKNTVYDKLLSL